MLIPRYYFSNDYVDFYNDLLKQPHIKRTISKDTYLWKPGDFIQSIYYIESGICVTSATHEDGHQKILYFNSQGSITPGFHNSQFKIEKSLTIKAITDMEVLEFSQKDIYNMYLTNPRFSAIAFENYAKLINLLIYETAHQEYNNSFLKLCNTLYLFSKNHRSTHEIRLSQENIADILAINRVNVAKCLSRLRDEGIIIPHRNWIEIIDFNKLESYCSQETLIELY